MTFFLTGLVLFLGVHSVSIVAPQWRDAQLAAPRRGAAGRACIRGVAALGFGLLIYGYGAGAPGAGGAVHAAARRCATSRCC